MGKKFIETNTRWKFFKCTHKFHFISIVQVVPHITDAIQDWIERVAAIPVDGKEGSPDVCVIELGGTIGTLFP